MRHGRLREKWRVKREFAVPGQFQDQVRDFEVKKKKNGRAHPTGAAKNANLQ
jgi:hypothetical protein